MTNKVTKTEVEGWYKYRGITIKRDDSAKGYWGHWGATVGSITARTYRKYSTQTRGELLALIDQLLDNPPVSE
jgi:hypothetical protein